MWGEILRIGRCERTFTALARLRFSPLEIFAQGPLQPFLGPIFCARSGLSLAFRLVILHRDPARRCRADRGTAMRRSQKPGLSGLAATDVEGLVLLGGIGRLRSWHDRHVILWLVCPPCNRRCRIGAYQGSGRLGRADGNRIGLELSLRSRRRGSSVDFRPFWLCRAPAGRLHQRRPCGKDRPLWWAPRGRFSLLQVTGQCCRSSVVEHSIGNGEVDSSILSGSTSFFANGIKYLATPTMPSPIAIAVKQRLVSRTRCSALSRCAAEPGPAGDAGKMGPGSAPQRSCAAKRPGHESSASRRMG
jgi:hypothetical protein